MKLINRLTLAVIYFLLLSVTNAQDFPEDKWFQIQSAQEAGKSNNGYWDIKGYPTTVKEGEIQNLSVYTIDNGPDRLYKFEEIDENQYKIVPKHGEADCCVQIAESKDKNGVNIFVGEEDSEANNGIFNLTYTGNGNWRIQSLDGRVICLAGRSSKNSNNVHLWENHQGLWTEWQLIDPASKKCYIPEADTLEEEAADIQEEILDRSNLPSDLTGINVKNHTGKGSEEFVANLDKSYIEMLKFENRINKLNAKVNNAKKILEKTSVVSGKLNDLDTRIKRLDDALIIFKKLPVIGPATTALSLSLNQVKTKLDNVNDKVQSFEKPVVRPACDGFIKLSDATSGFDDQLVSLNSSMITLKQQYGVSTSCLVELNDQNLTSTFDKNSLELSSNLGNINSELAAMNNELSKIEKVCEAINKLENPIKVVEKGVNGVNKVFKKTDGVTKKINSVLDKRFKKKILKKKINISVRDILTGGKVGKSFKSAAEKWANNLLKPVLKQLKIKIPEVPGVENVIKELESQKGLMNDLTNYHQKLNEYKAKVDNLKNGLNERVNLCLKDVPCK